MVLGSVLVISQSGPEFRLRFVEEDRSHFLKTGGITENSGSPNYGSAASSLRVLLYVLEHQARSILITAATTVRLPSRY